PVEIVERIHAIVVVVRAEELRLAQPAIAIPIDAAERLEVEVPFVRRDSAIAIVIEIGEPRRRPADVTFEPAGIVISRLPVRAALGTDPYFVAGQSPIAVPVVVDKRLCRSTPLLARNRTVAVGIHRLEPHTRRLLST